MRRLLTYSLLLGILLPGVVDAQPRYHQHKGFFAAVGLGVAEANFDLESGNDEAAAP